MARRQRDPQADDLATIQRLAGEGATIETIRAALGVGGGVWKRWARDATVQEALKRGPLLAKAKAFAAKYHKAGPIAAKLGITLKEFERLMKDREFADAIEEGRGLFEATLVDALTVQSANKSQAAVATARLIAEWREADRGPAVPLEVTLSLYDDHDDPPIPRRAPRPAPLEVEIVDPPKALPPPPPDLEAEVLADPPRSRDEWPTLEWIRELHPRQPDVMLDKFLREARERWADRKVAKLSNPPKRGPNVREWVGTREDFQLQSEQAWHLALAWQRKTGRARGVEEGEVLGAPPTLSNGMML